MVPSHLSFAKVNLSLRVLRRRDDGFHDVETRMVPISLHDEVIVEPTEPAAGEPRIEVYCDDPTVPTDENNLVWQAAEGFFKAAGIDHEGVRIELLKNIPHGAGLAGGSGNAATVLMAMDEIFDAQLGTDGLAPIAAGIGSDVVFFLHGGACDCSGRGEIVTPAPDAERELASGVELFLIKPPFGVSTPWAYGRWRDSRELPDVPYGAQAMPFGQMVNDLERPAFEKYLLLAEIKTWLLDQRDRGVQAALMSGSGSTVFAVLDPDRAESLGAELESEALEQFGPTMWIHRGRTL